MIIGYVFLGMLCLVTLLYTLVTIGGVILIILKKLGKLPPEILEELEKEDAERFSDSD